MIIKSVLFKPESYLKRLSTSRLLGILNRVRAINSHIRNHYGPRCWACCKYVGDDWENDVEKHSKPYQEYIAVIKGILKDREHVSRKSEKVSRASNRQRVKQRRS